MMRARWMHLEPKAKRRCSVRKKLIPILPGFVLLVLGFDSHAGQAATGSPSTPGTRMIIGMRTGDTHLTTAPMKEFGAVSHWVTWQTASASVRYRRIENAFGLATASGVQHQQAFAARFKADPRDRVGVHAGIFSGDTFRGGWNETGWGSGAGESHLFLKQLYVSAEPVPGVEVQYGGLAILHGESTEITSYDFDGYITGQRLNLRGFSRLFFDEISITYAYLGDLDRPNVLRRFHRLNESNYHQFLVAKSVGHRMAFSTDYTYDASVETLREGVKLHVSGLPFVDTLHFETYQRLGEQAGFGLAAYAEEKLGRRVAFGGGYARIDRSGLNSDRFPRGQSFHGNGHFVLHGDISVTVAVTHTLAAEPGPLPRWRLDIALGYSLLSSIHRAGF